ncbi:DUF1801 domain-containing protein [Sphingomonas bacterium]|uniref:DUF1801 domain-containing protein n=1 Tax=Sphingomonas bacterium TaxID=1895847 RepID=UPI002610B608|nr:DUF1801 domain-containing protein [Sphingomonas bacterium]MDB5679010.1 hypothetical protein [Sphingomonas bacterium]
MAENKTQFTDVPVDTFLATVTPERRVADARVLIELMRRLTGEPAAMYGPSIVAFGQCRYRTAAGREDVMPRLCFAPRKAALVLYGLRRGANHAALMPRLGTFKVAGGCTHIKALADVDMTVLEALLTEALAANRVAYPD